MGLGALGWTLGRPWALVGLGLVAVLVLLSLQRRKPRTVPLGTARLFVHEGAPEGAHARRWLSAARLAAIGALLAGTLALAAPHRAIEAMGGEALFALVDRTPSMYLPLDGVDGAAERRIDRAVARCREWARARSEERGVPLRIVWADAGSIGSHGEGREAPGSLLDPPNLTRTEPLWGAHDRPGVAWITDRAPSPRPRHAGVFASGGARAPGLVAVDGGGGWRTTQDPDAPLVRDESVPAAVVLVGPTLDPEIAELVEIWARGRGLAISRSADSEGAVLRVLGPGGAAPDGGVWRRIGRDGWTADVDLVPGPVDGPGVDWVTAHIDASSSRSAVTAGPGLVRTHFVGIRMAAETAAEFAVSWTQLLDASRVLPPGVVDLEERAAAGEGDTVAPVPIDLAVGTLPGAQPEADEALAGVAAREARQESRRVQTALALMAGVLGLLAALLRRRGSP